jgi:lysophospholipase
MKHFSWLAAAAALASASGMYHLLLCDALLPNLTLLTFPLATPYELSELPQRDALALALAARALPANAPNDYTPQIIQCPSTTPQIRSAANLSPDETKWLQVRRNATVEPMRDLLSRLNIKGLDTNAYINTHKNNASALPNIGIAVSGGGYRAMLNGAGIIQAFDDRSPDSKKSGHLGGLLQSATYLAGLSGGSWLVSTLYANNWTSIDAVLSKNEQIPNDTALWALDRSIFKGPEANGPRLLRSIGYYSALIDSVEGKGDAGFNTTITDYWGRALSYQIINATDGGPDYTWSSIADQDWFQKGQVPLPLIVADNRAPGETLVSTNSTVFTFTPWELGSDDPSLYAHAPLKYVGTNFTDGTPRDTSECVVGFDNVGFVFGTSSSLFNAALATFNNTDSEIPSALRSVITNLLTAIGQEEVDIADWVNPFLGFNNQSNPNAADPTLTLVDGGEDGQNIPLHPLIQPNRNVDIIFAVDSSADTNETFPTPDSAPGYPDGISLITTYQRSSSTIGNGTAFPEVPSLNTFMNLGLNRKPTFFGCDTSKFNSTNTPPLVVYMPNAPYVFQSNQSTFKMSYEDDERDAVVLNAYNMATQGNGTLDSQWPTCVGCAILSRSLERTSTPLPEVCQQCFTKYCWNGTVDDRTPGTYNPPLALAQNAVKTSSAGNSTGGGDGEGAGASLRDSSMGLMSLLAAGVVAGLMMMF